MSRPIRLSRLLKRNDQLVVALQQFCESNQMWIHVVDMDGDVIVGFGTPDAGADASIESSEVAVETTVIGAVHGPLAALVGPWLGTLANDAHLNRAVGAEVLQLYRQQRVLVSLAELLSETSEPEIVADMVADAVAKALSESAVAFLDSNGRVLATSGSAGEFDRLLRPAEVTISNGDGVCRLATPLVGAERRFGYLQAVRSAPDFTASEAELLSTISVIAASAIGRAFAHQRELDLATKRSSELEVAVARLRTELDLATTTVLASVLFTDLVDSTQSQASVGDTAWARLIETHNRSATKLVEGCGGTLVDFAGDGFFAWFDTPSAALECGRRHLELVEELGLQSRAGIHVGEAQQRGAGLSGMTVNTAARIMGQAGAGQLMVSGVTADLLGGTDHVFDWVGEVALKGLTGRFRLSTLVRD